MKVWIFIGLVMIGMTATMREEPMVLASTSVSLQDLLDKVKEISNQLAEESLIEISVGSEKTEGLDKNKSITEDI